MEQGEQVSRQVLMVLSDGETFGSADGSAILLAPDDADLTEDELEEFEDGRLPDTQDDWPNIAFKWASNGDFVAEVNLPGNLRYIVLLSAEQLSSV